MASLSTYCILCPSFTQTRWHKFRQRIILRRVSKSELPCYNGLHVSSWPGDSSTWLNVSNSSRRCLQSSFRRNVLLPSWRPRELTRKSLVFHGPVLPRCLLWKNWSRNHFLPRASFAVLRLVYDGLTFQTRAPETTLIFYKRDLHKYIATHYTRCERSSSCTHFLSLEVRATICSSRGEYFTICHFLVRPAYN